MRILYTSVVTLLIVSIAMIAAAPVDGQRGPIPNASKVAAPPDDAPKIDPSQVNFRLAKKGCTDSLLAGPPYVYGIVASGIDLSEDLTARQLLQMGITFGQEKCPSATFLDVYLRPDPVSDGYSLEDGFPRMGTSLIYYPSDLVEGGWSNKSPGWIVGYRNFARALKAQRIAEAEQARQRNAALEQQRQAEQRTAARWAAFVKANRVKHIVTIDQLTANPFVYEGQVVAISGTFERMSSRTQGIFSARGYRFLVSGISTSRFTSTGSVVVLAGRVLGNIEVKPGSTEVPHLSFVGVWVPN